MKIAGRKNDGAWFRANKLIKSLDAGEQAELALRIADLSNHGGAFEVIEDFLLAAGLTIAPGGAFPVDPTAWAETLAQTGIPRQVWFGRLSYDTYTRSGAPGSYVYTPDHQAVMHDYGVEIRKLLRVFTFARRAAIDLSNIAVREEGNPGGRADATEGN